jgi:hypothetical protein
MDKAMTDAVNGQSSNVSLYTGSSDKGSGFGASQSASTSIGFGSNSNDDSEFEDIYIPSTTKSFSQIGSPALTDLYASNGAKKAAAPKQAPEKAEPEEDPLPADVKQIFSREGKAFSELYDITHKKPFGPPPAPENPSFNPLAPHSNVDFYRVQIHLAGRAATSAYQTDG